MPYSNKKLESMDMEERYRLIISTIFNAIGLKVEVERMIATGRIDMVVQTSRYIYVIKLKLNNNGGKDAALQQILARQYMEPFKADFVRKSNLPEKKQLLSIIKSSEFAGDPDGREWKIKSTYPEVYRRLLNECYPTLRRTDYWVEFTVRSFNLEEAKKLVGTHPQKLSLQEMYNVAQTYEPGSEAYNEVFATAVRMFPQDAIANLNAANSALQRGDVITAEKYLQKAGDSGESVLARGVLAMLKGDKTKAVELMRKAQSMGIKAASANLEQIENTQK